MRNEYTVDILPKAILDIQSIFAYYYELSQDFTLAERITNEIETAILGLEKSPKAYPLSRDERLAKRGYRKLIVGDYIALYKVNDNSKTVSVAYVFHCRMDYEKTVK